MPPWRADPATCEAYRLGGLRIGWLAARDRELLAAAEAIKDYTTICSSGPSELLATTALAAGERILERNRGLVRANLELLRTFFARRRDRFRWMPPRAGPVAFPTLIGERPDQFCDRIREQAGVLLLPGTMFDADSGEIRIGFGRRNMPEALERLDAALG